MTLKSWHAMSRWLFFIANFAQNSAISRSLVTLYLTLNRSFSFLLSYTVFANLLTSFICCFCDVLPPWVCAVVKLTTLSLSVPGLNRLPLLFPLCHQMLLFLPSFQSMLRTASLSATRFHYTPRSFRNFRTPLKSLAWDLPHLILAIISHVIVLIVKCGCCRDLIVLSYFGPGIYQTVPLLRLPCQPSFFSWNLHPMPYLRLKMM